MSKNQSLNVVERAKINQINVFCAYDEIVETDSLKENPKNPNIHPEEQLKLLAEIIKQTGWRAPITVSNRSGFIIKGHGRLKAAILAGFEKVPVEYQNYSSEEEELSDMIADNKIAEFSMLDKKIIAELFENYQFTEDDIILTGYKLDEFEDIYNAFEESDKLPFEKANLKELFIAPPFSIFKANSGDWQKRKNAWIELGLKSETGRNKTFESLQKLHEKRRDITESMLKNSYKAGVSIFDPVLCEIVYSWFSKENDTILDPFAGGSVRGIIASKLKRKYVGIELRQEQVKANIENANELCDECFPQWITGDSNIILDTLENESCNMILSCPPYVNLEVYSDDPADISNMMFSQFYKIYSEIIKKSYSKLKENSFAVWVVGEVREKNGNYYNFIGETISAFLNAGYNYYNEIILETPVGTAALRAANAFRNSRKVCKIHQNVLVFIKGDAKEATKRLGDVVIKELETDCIETLEV